MPVIFGVRTPEIEVDNCMTTLLKVLPIWYTETATVPTSMPRITLSVAQNRVFTILPRNT